MLARRSPGHLRDCPISFCLFSRRVTSGSASLLYSHFSWPICSYFLGPISVMCSRLPRSRFSSSLFWVTSTCMRGFRPSTGWASLSFASAFSSLGILLRAPPRCAEDARSSAFIFRCGQRNRRRDLCHARHEARRRGHGFSPTRRGTCHLPCNESALDVDRRCDDGARLFFAVGRPFH